jgi:hypothetical protein
MIVRIGGLIVWLAAMLVSADLTAEELRPRSILYLDQSDLHGPFYHQIFSAFRAQATVQDEEHTTLYAEDLDISRFKSDAYRESLRRLLSDKYRDRPIGVIVAVGSDTMELVLKWRAELWPNVPVVFTQVEK